MGRVGSLLVTRRVFWRAVVQGFSSEAAAGRAGVSAATGRRWFSDAGGMCPVALSEPSGRFLSLAEREEIACGIAAGLSVREIGRRAGRPASTVSRELARNSSSRGAGYRAHVAQHKAERRARRPKPTRLELVPALRAVVQAMLNEKYSPQQIAGRLVVEFPDDLEMRMSHETVYRSVYLQAAGELRKDLKTCLRTGRAVRKPRRRADGRGGSRILDMVMISDRPFPTDDDDRPLIGIWQGDLIVGLGSRSAIGTLVDSRTGFLKLLHLPEDHRAETVRDAIITAVSDFPDALRRSLTWDQGVELARHAQITIATGLPVYFCNPHSPWERPANENINGLLRQYFPKGTDLSVHTPEVLRYVEHQLNTRPRARHGFLTPAEVLAQLLCDPEQQPGVATTT